MDWNVVTKKSKSRIRSFNSKTLAYDWKISYLSYNEKIKEIKLNPSFIQFAREIEKFCKGHIIAVGIGNFSYSLYSTSQQALYELLLEFRNQLCGEHYDPALLIHEKQYLEDMQSTVNQGHFSKIRTEDCTFFMIHCHYSLYESLLDEEWISSTKIVIIGNSIEEMASKFHSLNASQICRSFKSLKLYTSDLAFNDTYINKNFED